MPHPFLSQEWVAEARAIYARHAAAAAASVPLRMNLVVEDVPFSEGGFAAHLDASTGVAEVDVGHLDDPDLTVTLPYEVAKAVLIDGDAQVGVEAFFTGRVRVDGDVTRLLAFQQAAPNEDQLVLSEEIRSVTS